MNNNENLERLLQDVREACALSREEDEAAAPTEEAPDDDYISIMEIFSYQKPHRQPEAPPSDEEEPEEQERCNGILEPLVSLLSEKSHPVEDDHKTTVGRVFHTAGYMLLSLLVLGVVAGYILFAHDLRAMMSIEQVEVNANVYNMVYSGEYGFDEFLDSGGAATEEELMDFLSRRFICGLGTMHLMQGHSEVPADSILTVRNSKRLEGSLVGRTFNRGEETLAMVVTTRMDSGRESVSTVDLSRLGYTPYDRPEGLDRYAALASVYLPLDGMNDRGVVVTALECGEDNACEDTEKPDLTATTAVRLLLDRARSADHAVDLLAGYDIFPSGGRYYDFAVSDGSGRALVVSTAGNVITVTESPCAVNSGISTPSTLYRLPQNGERMESLRDTYDQYDGHMTKPQMFSAMRRAAVSGDGWLVVYDTGRLTAEYCFDGDFDRQYAVSMH